MTPRDVDRLEPAELTAFWRLLEDDVREQQRQARAAKRRR
jgi:hypothetical protein